MEGLEKKKKNHSVKLYTMPENFRFNERMEIQSGSKNDICV